MVGICHRLGLAQASFERGTAIDATAPRDVFPGDGAFFFVLAHGCVLLRHVFLCCGNLLLHMFVLQCCFRGCRVVFVACPSAFGRSRVFVSKLVLSHVASHAMPQPGSQVQGGTLRTMPSSTRSGVPVPSPLTFAPLHDQGMPAIHCGKRLLLCQ